jgi:hypothetical protein
MIRGKELAQAILDHVTKHPERHHQECWVNDPQHPWKDDPVVSECGTVACLAGWAVLLNGTTDGTMSAYAMRDSVAVQLGLDASTTTWENVALKLLFPDYDPANWTVDRYGTDDPVYKASSAFYVTNSESEAIKRFAEAFDLEVPTHE